MNGNSIALDTNVAVHVLNDAPAALQFLRTFTEICLPTPVLGELRYGALNSARSDWRIGQIVANVAWWARGPSNEAVWEVSEEEFVAAAESHLAQQQPPTKTA